MVYQLNIDEVYQYIGKVVAERINTPERIVNQVYCGYDWPEKASLIEKPSWRKPNIFQALEKAKTIYQKRKLQILGDKI